MIDDEASYQKWKWKGSWECIGMRKQASGKEHGIVREIGPNFIGERTYKQGVAHGLSRWIDNQQIDLRLFQDGVEIAFVKYNDKFERTQDYQT